MPSDQHHIKKIANFESCNLIAQGNGSNVPRAQLISRNLSNAPHPVNRFPISFLLSAHGDSVPWDLQPLCCLQSDRFHLFSSPNSLSKNILASFHKSVRIMGERRRKGCRKQEKHVRYSSCQNNLKFELFLVHSYLG